MAFQAVPRGIVIVQVLAMLLLGALAIDSELSRLLRSQPLSQSGSLKPSSA